MAQRNRSLNPRPAKSRATLTITYPNSACIDIDRASHFVTVAPDRYDHTVREFPSLTVEINALAD